MSNYTNILHLSDIHFGLEPTATVTASAIRLRQDVLNALVNKLKTINKEWRPDVVVVSGDIGWKGITTDYDQAEAWLSSLLRELGLEATALVTCPGNHDISRKSTKGMGVPKDAAEADDWLVAEDLENFVRPFQPYSDFYTNLGIPLWDFAGNKSAILGMRIIQDIRFVSLNSAWFCRGDEDRGKLWIGLPLLQVMSNAGHLADRDKYDTEQITVILLHHPGDWLSDNETSAYGNRPATYQYLAERSHIILSGHVHGAILEPSRIHNRAYRFTGGAAYAGSKYENTFTILRVDRDNRSVRKRSFEYDNRYQRWNELPIGDEIGLFIGKRSQATSLSVAKKGSSPNFQ